MKKRFLPGMIGMLGIMMLSGCGKEESLLVSDNAKFDTDLNAMDTYMTLTAYGKNANKGLDSAKEAIKQVERTFSVTDKESDIYKINHRDTDMVRVSDEVLKVCNEALTISAQSGGKFDISIYPVLTEWGFTTGEYQVPEASRLQEILDKVGYDKIQIDEEGKTITLEEGMEIDFGGIAKGYSGDEATSALKQAGVTSAILSLGGNIQTLGSKPDGSKWNVAIKNPKNVETYMGVIKVADKAVVTSGGYERYFEDEDGNLWWHIIDPATGYPANTGILSISIIGNSGMECDALSTALFVAGVEGAAEYWKQYGGFDMIIITEEEEVYITEGIKKDFSLVSDYESKDVNVITK